MPTLTAIKADITTLEIDAIVNAAKESLLGGGGVDGAIHARAGSGLLAECERMPEVSPGVRCRVGEAKITGGYLLPARHVIHTVGPVWTDEDPLWCDAQLAACYRNCIALAGFHRVRSIAFPCISTGAFGFPWQRAAQIALASVRQALASHRGVQDVRFVCFSDRDLMQYSTMIRMGG